MIGTTSRYQQSLAKTCAESIIFDRYLSAMGNYEQITAITIPTTDHTISWPKQKSVYQRVETVAKRSLNAAEKLTACDNNTDNTANAAI